MLYYDIAVVKQFSYCFILYLCAIELCFEKWNKVLKNVIFAFNL